MSNTGGHSRHDETRVGQGFSASNGAVVNTGDQHFYGHESRSSQRRSLRELLWFPQIRSREGAISCEHDGTCTWLLDTPEYASWRADECNEPRQRLLWIKGKVGAGKSTMMKFAVKQSRKRWRDELVLPHFFNARGAAIESSTEGMYRTLLHWLLEKLPKHFLRGLESLYRYHKEKQVWQIPALVDILEAALEGIADRPVTFYIDALDECPQEEIRDMLRVFRKIVRKTWRSGQRVRVCFASRPYPSITFTDAIFLDFSRQEHHLKDLEQYITDELQLGTSRLALQIQHNVLNKAQGSFMWAVLVVRILNTEYDGGHMDKLYERLHDVPSGLSDLYSHILQRFPDNHDALLACCQWMIFAKGFVFTHGATGGMVHQLWWAIRLKVDGDEKITRELYKTSSDEDMERYIVGISKGLVEIRNHDPNTRSPQFLHESAREFILRPNDLWTLCGARDYDKFAALGHEAVRDCLLISMESERPTLQTFAEAYGQGIPAEWLKSRWAEFEDGKWKHPHAFIAAITLLYHADQAQKLGLDQTAFLVNLNRRCGPFFLDPERVTQMSWSGVPVRVLRSIIAVLMAAGATHIMRATQLPLAQRAWLQGRAFGLVDDDGQTSLLANLKFSGQGYYEAFEPLLDIYLRLQPRHHELQAILSQLALYWRSSPNRVDKSFGHPLVDAAVNFPNLGSFILLALVANSVLEPHITHLKDLFPVEASEPVPIPGTGHWVSYFSRFLRLFYLFLDKGISSPAISFESREVLLGTDLVLDELYNRPPADRLVCIETIGMIKRLVCARQSKPSRASI